MKGDKRIREGIRKSGGDKRREGRQRKIKKKNGDANRREGTNLTRVCS